MAHKPTAKMINTPHITVDNYCANCPHMQEALKQDTVDWGTIRNACRCCKTGSAGIYKADAIYDFLKLKNTITSNLTPGRKPTRHKTHGKLVNNLKSQNKTLKEIRDITGLSINTIRKILKEVNNYDTGK